MARVRDGPLAYASTRLSDARVDGSTPDGWSASSHALFPHRGHRHVHCGLRDREADLLPRTQTPSAVPARSSRRELRIARAGGSPTIANVTPMPHHAHREPNVLRLKRLGIDTYREPVIYMAADCPACRSEGWTAEARIQVTRNGRSIIATLNVITGALLAPDEASLSDIGWQRLDAHDGDLISLAHPAPVESLGHIRAKVFGHRLTDAAITTVVNDIVAGRDSAIELAAFVTAFAGGRLTLDETVAPTRAMTSTGERLYWGRSPIVDKHCVGGLPGNRTTMILVPVVAAHGLTMPKTSSRAITSPAGTADVMETLAPVALDLPTIRRVVEREVGRSAEGIDGGRRGACAARSLGARGRSAAFDTRGNARRARLRAGLSARQPRDHHARRRRLSPRPTPGATRA